MQVLHPIPVQRLTHTRGAQGLKLVYDKQSRTLKVGSDIGVLAYHVVWSKRWVHLTEQPVPVQVTGSYSML